MLNLNFFHVIILLNIQMDEYIFDSQSEEQLWGDNKPFKLEKIEDVFKHMNEDLFKMLENQHGDMQIRDVFKHMDEDLFKILETQRDDDVFGSLEPSSLNEYTYGQCLLGVNCTNPATHLLGARYKSLKSIKTFSCEKHVSFNMVPIDSWLCKASINSGPKCINKARCYIDYKYGPIYCPFHAKKIWLNDKYTTNK
jgi:hypothetical protein